MSDMKTVVVSSRSRFRILHIEAPGCIVNIHHNLRDAENQAVTAISVSADGDRYSGDPKWWINGEPGNAHFGVRVVQCADAPKPTVAPLVSMADRIVAAVPETAFGNRCHIAERTREMVGEADAQADAAVFWVKLAICVAGTVSPVSSSRDILEAAIKLAERSAADVAEREAVS